MKQFLRYFRFYFQHLDKRSFFLISLFTAALVILNYTWSLDALMKMQASLSRFIVFFLLYAFTFSTAYFILYSFSRRTTPIQIFFYFLLIIAPAIFAAKVAFSWPVKALVAGLDYPWNTYWTIVLKWPVKCLYVLLAITCIWLIGKYKSPFGGLSIKGVSFQPYWLLFFCMIPLVVLAATNSGFQNTYPKVKSIAFIKDFVSPSFLYHLMFEIFYGIDFFTIEFFFRGFLVLAFVRYAGKEAILPMAVFYCVIHFGKPLGECITSYFGGIILGVIVYYTKSIFGGLLVHLGIAWLMEVAGYIATHN